MGYLVGYMMSKETVIGKGAYGVVVEFSRLLRISLEKPFHIDQHSLKR